MARSAARSRRSRGAWQGVVTAADVAAIEAEAADEIARACAFAEASPLEPVEDLAARREGAAMKLTYRDAMREALREALRADPRVILIGEDIGKYGGTYAVTRGLLDEFGPERVRDAPLSESAFVGAGIGAAINGLRPIVEIMTVNFSLLALDQIVNGAATLRHMSGGQLEVPLVIRMATGAGRQLAAQHSHSLENWYAHVPGPARPRAGDRRRRARHARDRAARARSGDPVRARPALRASRTSSPAARRSISIARRSAGPATTRRSSPTAARCPARSRRRRRSRPRASRPR